MSEITGITAGIGGGKSLLATQIGFKEFLNGNRFIVSNCSWIVEEWAYAYFKIKKQPAPIHRIRIITPEETKFFWLYLPGRTLKTIDEVAARQAQDQGCVYILDELHLVYPARDWAKTAQEVGVDVEKYVSQLRKLNDDLYWITQHTEKLDKNFRRNTTSWVVVKNLGKARLLLGVGLPNKFVSDYFPQQPVGKDKPEYTVYYNRITKMGDFLLDYGKLYRTMGGIGFEGNRPPEDKPKRKHWSVWILALLVIIALCFIVPRIMSSGAGALIGINVGNFKNKLSQAAGVSTETTSGTPAGVSTSAKQGAFSQPKAPVLPAEHLPTIQVTGYTLMGDHLEIMFTDGTKRRTTNFKRNGDTILTDGELYTMAKPTQNTNRNEMLKSVFDNNVKYEQYEAQPTKQTRYKVIFN